MGNDLRQFVRAGIVVAILMLSAIGSSVMAREATVNQIRAEDRRMLIEMLQSGRNSVALGKHDTAGIAYAIPTDSILGVTQDGSNRIYCRGVDGISSFRVRLYNRRAPNPPTPVGAIVGDTMVIGCGAWGDTTKVAPNAPCALDSAGVSAAVPQLCASALNRWPTISCANPAASPAPSCVDTVHSVSNWRTAPCAWLQNSATTIACYPIGTLTAPPPSSGSSTSQRQRER